MEIQHCLLWTSGTLWIWQLLDLAADGQSNGGQLQHGPSGTGGHHGPVMLGGHMARTIAGNTYFVFFN